MISMAISFLTGPFAKLAGVGLVVFAAFVWFKVETGKAYTRGVQVERAVWQTETARRQKEHDEAVAALQSEIDMIAREHEEERSALAEELSRLQLKIGSSDEDFLVSADEPVFSDGLLSELDALGRD